jgi:hypothetical protein
MKYKHDIDTLLFLIFPFSLFGQSLHDANSILGSALLNWPEKNGAINIVITSNNIHIDTIDINYSIDAAMSTISNSKGELQFYCDGCRVINRYHNIMPNGDSINSPGSQYSWNCSVNQSYITHQGIITLPIPDTENDYVVFHLRMDEKGLFLPTSLLYTTVDMAAESGLGKVTSKNVVILKDTLRDMLTAVRHGNGRDWWIVAPHYQGKKIALAMLTPDGVSQPVYQEAPMEDIPEFFQIYGWLSQAVFTPDGTRYARLIEGGYGRGYISLYDFNRCTGEFCCGKNWRIDNKDNVDDLAADPNGIAFSPNGRYLYATTGTNLYQYDTNSDNIPSTQTLVGQYDGALVSYLPATLYRPYLAANGKIYITASNGIHALHTIHAPNEPGLACDFRNHDLDLPVNIGFCLPHFPNFRLYDWDRSPCDSLGIDAPSIELQKQYAWDNPVITPNPASTFCSITAPACTNGVLSVFDAAGRLIFEEQGVQTGNTIHLSVGNWASGVYLLVLRSEKSQPKTVRLVVTR